jgi:hypothetical protein
MATIIVRTNPDKGTSGTAAFKCSQCRKPFDSFAAAKRCAQRDYRKRTGQSSTERVAV